jgi:hypothetical protein
MVSRSGFLGEIFARQEAQEAARKRVAATAGPFRPVRLKTRDDRELWWDDLQVAWLVHAMDGTARVSGATQDRLLARWPHLEPGYFQYEAKLSLNSLRFKQCPQCREYFIGHHATRTCSDDCRALWIRRNNTATKQKSRARSKNYRDEEQHDCPQCGGCFYGGRSTRRFCSDRCRKAASRAL